MIKKTTFIKSVPRGLREAAVEILCCSWLRKLKRFSFKVLKVFIILKIVSKNSNFP